MKVPDKPIKMTSADWILEVLSGLILITGLLYAGLNYVSLPETIPTHVGINGKPDGFGNKFMLLILIAVHIGVYFLLTYAPKFGSINYPYEINSQNEAQQVKNVFLMVRVLKLLIVIMFSYILYSTIQTAFGLQNGLGMIMPVIIISIMATVGGFTYYGYRTNKQIT